MQVGDLITFVCAPPRWKGDGPREPAGLLGKVGVLLTPEPVPESHGWGGLYDVLVDGKAFQYYGDFIEATE